MGRGVDDRYMTHLSPQLETELRHAWSTAAATGTDADNPAADAAARAEVLYEVTRVLYDETRSNRLRATPGESESVAEVTDAAMRHNNRAWRMMKGATITLDPKYADQV